MKLVTRKLIGCDYFTVQRSSHASVYNAHMALSLNCDALQFMSPYFRETFTISYIYFLHFLIFIFAL
jgi:hypothetical protein